MQDHVFVVDNGASYTTGVDSRERTIGLNNRVIAGMLLHATRMRMQDCESKDKFDNIEFQYVERRGFRAGGWGCGLWRGWGL